MSTPEHGKRMLWRANTSGDDSMPYDEHMRMLDTDESDDSNLPAPARRRLRPLDDASKTSPPPAARPAKRARPTHTVKRTVQGPIANYKVVTIGTHNKLVVYVDTRERDAAKHDIAADPQWFSTFQTTLAGLGVECEKRSLPLGDINWVARDKLTGDEDVVGLLENKRANDLLQSIYSAHFQEQRARMDQCELSHRYFVTVLDGMYGKLDAKAKTAMMTTIVKSSGALIANRAEYMDYLVAITKMILNDTGASTPAPELRALSWEQFCGSFKKAEIQTPADFLMVALQSIHGLTAARALEIAERYESIDRLVTALQLSKNPESMLCNTFGNKLVNATVSKKVYQLLIKK